MQKLIRFITSGKYAFVCTSLVALTTWLVFPDLAKSQNIQPCHLAERSLGNRCYQRVSVESRHVAYGEDTSYGKSESTSFDGWVIIGWSDIVELSKNNGSASIQYVQGGSNYQISNLLDNYDYNLRDLKDKLQARATVPINGIPVDVGGMIERINYALNQNQTRRSLISSAKSNVDHILLTSEASGRCTRVIFGACVDNAGGWYKGYVDVYMQYVGNSNEISSQLQGLIDQGQQTLQTLEQTSDTQDPFTSKTPSAPFFNSNYNLYPISGCPFGYTTVWDKCVRND